MIMRPTASLIGRLSGYKSNEGEISMTKGTFATVDCSLAGSSERMRNVIDKVNDDKITDLERQADRILRTSYLSIYSRIKRNAELGVEETSIQNDFLTDEEQNGFVSILTTLGYTVELSNDRKIMIIKVPS